MTPSNDSNMLQYHRLLGGKGGCKDQIEALQKLWVLSPYKQRKLISINIKLIHFMPIEKSENHVMLNTSQFVTGLGLA